MIGAMVRLLHLVAVALGLVVVTASPAAADPAGPSDFRSEVTGLSPAAEGVEAEIRGGDSFLELTVAKGHTVIVEGYTGEPYLRFQPDGTVERNRLSEATYLNDDRRGAGITVPPAVRSADAGTPPDWQPIASRGTYAWHDHRVHWMQDASPGVARGQRVQGAYDPWRVPIVVDGASTEVQGTLVYAATVSPLPYAALVLIVAGCLAWFGRGSGLRIPVTVLALVALAAVVVGWADYRATPEGGGNPLLWALAAVALAAAVAAVVLARRSAGVGPGPGCGGRAVRVGPVPGPGPAQAGAAHRPAVRRRPRHHRRRPRRQRRRRLLGSHQRSDRLARLGRRRVVVVARLT